MQELGGDAWKVLAGMAVGMAAMGSFVAYLVKRIFKELITALNQNTAAFHEQATVLRMIYEFIKPPEDRELTVSHRRPRRHDKPSPT